ncbi:MAG: hypothetical protein ACPH7I_04565, partial [Flavobacteriaceae bacterium]
MQNTTNRAFLYDLGGYLAVGVIIICAIISVFAYVIVPDSSVNANQMHLSIHSQSPGFEVKMLSIPSTKDKEVSSFYSLLLGNPDPAIQYPISSYEIGENGIWIEHYNFDSPGQREWFSISSFGCSCCLACCLFRLLFQLSVSFFQTAGCTLFFW